MIYEVRRTSVHEYDPEVKPCEGVMTLYTSSYWRSDTGYAPIWAIELNTTQELMDFMDKIGNSIVIYVDDDESDYPIIEIYDSYRE